MIVELKINRNIRVTLSDATASQAQAVKVLAKKNGIECEIIDDDVPDDNPDAP